MSVNEHFPLVTLLNMMTMLVIGPKTLAENAPQSNQRDPATSIVLQLALSLRTATARLGV